MPLLSKPSSAARTALIYITTGALIDVWTGIWYLYLKNRPGPEVPLSTWYLCYALLLTGVVLLIIGLLLGQIGRSARHAELPPPEVTHEEAAIDQNAATRAPVVAPVNPAAAPVAAQPGATPPAPPTAIVATPATPVHQR